MARYVQALCLFVLIAFVASTAARDRSSLKRGGRRSADRPECNTDNSVCYTVDDNTGVMSFSNDNYIEVSLEVKFPTKKNLAITTPDGKKAGAKIRTVLPARQPGGDAPVTEVLTMTVVNSNKESSWASTFQTRQGSYKAKHSSSAKYRLPFAGKRKVAQGFNGKATHTGNMAFSIDFAMEEGTRVLATRDGVVFLVDNANYRSKFDAGVCPKPVKKTCDAEGSDANRVLIAYDDGTFGEFAHFKLNGVKVLVGTRVSAGDLLGFSGNTGMSTGPHVHVSVNRATSFDDARKWFFESIKVAYIDANGKSVTPLTGKEYEGAPE